LNRGSLFDLKLREFQVDAIEYSLKALKEKGNSSIILPTGSGNSIICANIIQRVLTEGLYRRVFILSDNRNSILQFENLLKSYDETRQYSIGEKFSLINLNTIQSFLKEYTTEETLDGNNLVIIYGTTRTYKKLEQWLMLSDCGKFTINASSIGLEHGHKFPYYNVFGQPDYVYTFREGVIDGYFNDYYIVRSVIDDINDYEKGLYYEINNYFKKHNKYNLEEFTKFIIKKNDLDSEKELLLKQLNEKSNESPTDKLKSVVDEFERMLDDDDYFDQLSKEANGLESVWQKFFERNKWIFGTGLNLVCCDAVNSEKLEQVIKGATFNSKGSRVDALLGTRGVINSVVLTEIKTHRTKLLSKSHYRNQWTISSELNGAITQAQRYSQDIVDIGKKIDLKDRDGNPLGRSIYTVQPKSYVVIGSLREFSTPNGVNEDKYIPFELYRRQISNPEIITFDELFSRVAYMLEMQTL